MKSHCPMVMTGLTLLSCLSLMKSHCPVVTTSLVLSPKLLCAMATSAGTAQKEENQQQWQGGEHDLVRVKSLVLPPKLLCATATSAGTAQQEQNQQQRQGEEHLVRVMTESVCCLTHQSLCGDWCVWQQCCNVAQ